MARDNQRKKVYTWERALKLPEAATAPLTLKQCEQLVKRIYTMYGQPVPRVTDGRGSSNARGGRWSVHLPRWARTGATVCHEAAHGLAQIYAHGTAWHAPEFVAIMAELLNQLYGVSLYYLDKTAAEHRVKMCGQSYKPQAVRERVVRKYGGRI